MLEAFLDKTLTVERQDTSAGPDASGGIARTWSTRLSGVACCLAPARSVTRYEFMRQDLIAEYEIYTAVDIAATTADRLLIGGKYHTVIGYNPYDNSIFGPGVFVTIVGRRNGG